ncbi:unnamed protein product [Eruca vesicaria subsp. sativa]|uniref:F-box domain-containing protein n=1 Tax=Eruca vesicaria subsp. sativa TaxID=29727 RepID=A0ABC8IVD8_ERUVS|nr:unnamed protein product [Eruca vesicaria subsp. sativa]
MLKTRTTEVREMFCKLSMEDVPLPRELTIEILEKLPAKSLARFMVTEKFWHNTITSKRFEEDYISLSEQRPKILFVATSKNESASMTHRKFRSILEKPVVCNPFTAVKQTLHATFNSELPYVFTPPVRDLLCFFHNKKSLVCNPCMGRFIPLPDVRRESYFHLGLANGEFKVLSLVKGVYNTVASVITLTQPQDGNNKWRAIDSGFNHKSFTHRGFCFRGVINYAATIDIGEHMDRPGIMCFDVERETFKFIDVPREIAFYTFFGFVRLVNFHDTLAVAVAEFNGKYDPLTIWHLEDDKWCKHIFQLPKTPTVVFEPDLLKFIGTSGATSELVFAPTKFLGLDDIEHYVVYYDYVRGTLDKVRIEGDFHGFQGDIEPFLGYIESTALAREGVPC